MPDATVLAERFTAVVHAATALYLLPAGSSLESVVDELSRRDDLADGSSGRGGGTTSATIDGQPTGGGVGGENVPFNASLLLLPPVLQGLRRLQQVLYQVFVNWEELPENTVWIAAHALKLVTG